MGTVRLQNGTCVRTGVQTCTARARILPSLLRCRGRIYCPAAASTLQCSILARLPVFRILPARSINSHQGLSSRTHQRTWQALQCSRHESQSLQRQHIRHRLFSCSSHGSSAAQFKLSKLFAAAAVPACAHRDTCRDLVPAKLVVLELVGARCSAAVRWVQLLQELLHVQARAVELNHSPSSTGLCKI